MPVMNRFQTIFFLFFLSQSWVSWAADDAHASAPDLAGPRVEVDYSQAPQCAAFAVHAGKLVEEWYPQIRKLLASDGQSPPPQVIKLTFLPMEGVAWTANTDIHISADWVTKRDTNDFGMVIHEMTHIVQNYHGGGQGWLTEGIADYVRYRYFEPGVLKPHITEKSSYREGYKTTAAFLIWLAENKDPQIVVKLNSASRENRPVIPIFKESTGLDLDDLWHEFADAARKKRNEPATKN